MKPIFSQSGTTIYNGDCMDVMPKLPEKSINTVVTSPPFYGLRDYGLPPRIWPAMQYSTLGGSIAVPSWVGTFGLEDSPAMFVGHAVMIFREVHRVLRDDGTCWLNLGDTYATSHSSKKDPGPRFDGRANVHVPSGNWTAADGDEKLKDLMGIPWQVAFALRADGWYLRQDNIWSKPNPMPQSCTDRCTTAHEYMFLLSKSRHYHFDADAIAEPASEARLARWDQDIENQQGSLRANGGAKINGPMKAVRKGGGASFGPQTKTPKKPAGWDTSKGNHDQLLGRYPREVQSRTFDRPVYEKRNKRSVWHIPTHSFKAAHFATFPPALVEPCIRAGCPKNGTVMDPFFGSGTTGLVAQENFVRCIGIEQNAEYCQIAIKRLQQGNLFTETTPCS